MASKESTEPQLAPCGGDACSAKAVPEWPYFAPDEIEAASAVLRSGKVNYWTGEEGRHFEREYAVFVGTKYAIALASPRRALIGPFGKPLKPVASRNLTVHRLFQAFAVQINRNHHKLPPIRAVDDRAQ